MKLSIIIPCHNEELAIGKVIRSLPHQIQEVIVVDNNSTDKTATIAKELGAKVIFEPKKGYGAALKAGFAHAKGDIIITFDGDGQHPHKKIGGMLRHLEKNNLDFVSGNRFPVRRSSMTMTRIFGNKALTFAANLLFGLRLKDSQSGMWVFRRNVLDVISLESDDMPLSQEFKIKVALCPSLTFEEYHIPYSHRVGESKLYPFKHGFLNLFSLLTLRLQYRPKKKSLQSLVILGLSHEHDSGIALVSQSGILYAANEERFNREKFTKAMPATSLAYLFDTVPTKPRKIHAVAIGGRVHVTDSLGEWEHPSLLLKVMLECLALVRLDRLFFGTRLGARFVTFFLFLITNPYRTLKLRRFCRAQGINAPLKLIDHHHAHAAGAYGASGYSQALIVTLDGQGDGMCSRIYKASGSILTLVHEIPFFHSPGHYYEYVTLLLGFKIGREGKVAGLAAYGNPEKTAPIFRERISFDSGKMFFKNHGFYRLPEIRYLKKKLANFSREDIAAGIQRCLEELVSAYITTSIQRFMQVKTNVVLAGGVFANVKLNQKIAQLVQVKKLFIYPHMGDGGLAAGAAMALLHKEGPQPFNLSALFLGPQISEREIQETLDIRSVRYTKPFDMIEKLTERLVQGKVVAICRGRMEYGPRALGNRSILYQATDPTVNNWLNKKLNRAEFMPFAPVLRNDDLPQYFTGYQKCEESLAFMTITLNATDRAKKEAPAIIHVDGTARPQVVTRESNPFIYEVLTAYQRKTQLRLLINTSFNMHEEPIVFSQKEALDSFLQSKLDTLILGPFLIDYQEKER